MPFVADDVNVCIVCESAVSPLRNVIVTGSFGLPVVYSIVTAWPAVTEVGTLVKLRELDCAAQKPANVAAASRRLLDMRICST